MRLAQAVPEHTHTNRNTACANRGPELRATRARKHSAQGARGAGRVAARGARSRARVRRVVQQQPPGNRRV
eukprot:691201-Alexandrium_andersonii.AAC.1